MNDNANLYRAFVDLLSQHRTEVLDNYVAELHNLGGRFLREDRLILLVRAGSLLDALLEFFPANLMDSLSAFFNAHVNQLLASGYSVEQITQMYDTLERAITQVAQRYVQNTSALMISLRQVRSAMQLARIVAVNIHLSSVAANINNSSYATPTNTPRFVNSFHPNPVSKRPEPPVVPRPVFFNENTNGHSNGQSNKPKFNFEAKVGYLKWPLEAVVGTAPPQYKAYLSDGNLIEVLLVDKTEAYAPPNSSQSNTAACHIRKIGPVNLAYPI